jgi:hypothetical protein
VDARAQAAQPNGQCLTADGRARVGGVEFSPGRSGVPDKRFALVGEMESCVANPYLRPLVTCNMAIFRHLFTV